MRVAVVPFDRYRDEPVPEQASGSIMEERSPDKGKLG